MKILKKSLSVFLSLLMIFSACSVGMIGAITASAAAGDSKYTHDEVVALIDKAIASTAPSLSTASNTAAYTSDDGSYLAAADAIYDYTVKTYREGKQPESKYNSSDTLYNAFISEFSADFTSAELPKVTALVSNVINPAGSSLYGYDTYVQSKDITYTSGPLGEEKKKVPVGTDVTDKFPYNTSNYSSAVPTSIVTKKSSVVIDLNKYLQTFEKIEDIPASFLTSVNYSYAHTYSNKAVVKQDNMTSKTECGVTTYSYSYVITTSVWNYISGKPVRSVTKNTTARKQLLSYEKYFTDELLAMTFDDMIGMSLADIEKLYNDTRTYYDVMIDSFSPATLTHFGFDFTLISNLYNNLEKAYKIILGKHSIDVLNTYIGSEYSEDNYSEMSSLYTKIQTAYDVVYAMDNSTIDYIVGDGNYSDEYNSAIGLKATADTYIATLYDVMTEQRLEELVASMTAMEALYRGGLVVEDLENPPDAEVIGLKQKADSYNEVLSLYTSKQYYRYYYSAEFEALWDAIVEDINDVYEVRGLRDSFQTYYSFFTPILFTTQIVDLDADGAMSLYNDLEANLENLKSNYNDVKNAWGETVAKNIFTINYEGADKLLQDVVEATKSTGSEALKQNIIDRNDAQLEIVKTTLIGCERVDFSNFAAIKSVLSAFNQDLYDFVADKNWLTTDNKIDYNNVAALLERYHAFTTTDGKQFFNENFTFADANGNFAVRYAGAQTIIAIDEETGEEVEVQVGFANDIARNNEDSNGDGVADDNYYVTEEKLVNTVVRIDNFITSRDFGALVGLVDAETEEPTDIKSYLNTMLADMLYTDNMMNTLVGAIFPMVVELINTELIGMLAEMGTPNVAGANAAIDLDAMDDNLGGVANLFLDNAQYKGTQYQRYLSEVFADIGLYIYPGTLADSLAMSNPAEYGPESEIYKALKAANRDWTQLVCEDNPDTIDVDETKVLEFAWGVYDEDSFIDTLACILDAILPLLQAALAGADFSGSADNAAYAFIPKLSYSILSADNVAARGNINLSIKPLTLYADLIVPLFEVLGVEKIPTLSKDCSGDDIARAVFGTLLDRVDEILDAPLSTILDILPNLVYFLSMDSVQEIINSAIIVLDLGFEVDIDTSNSGTLATILSWFNVESLINDMLAFPVELALGEMLNLYDLLGFEITNFNDILAFVLETTDLGITLPPLKQEEIIFCSDWSTNAAGRVDLQANKGDLMYWFLDYVITAIGSGNLLDALLADAELDPTIKSLLDKIVWQVVNNPDGALAAIVELLNPTTYDLTAMEWKGNSWNYDGIEGANQMSIVYLNYGNDWTKEDAQYLVENAETIISTILEMTGSEAVDLGALLSDAINGIWTNENITAIIELLGGLGDSASAVINDVIANQVGINIGSWFIAFGYLFPEGTWKEDAEVLQPDHRNYVNDFGITGTANEDGSITWSYNGAEFVDGDSDMFIDILCALLSKAEIIIKFLFAGQDISAFGDLLTVKGYETYDTTFGLLFEMLGVTGLPSQAEFDADTMGSFKTAIHAAVNWLNSLIASDNMIEQLLEMIPDLFYFIESNGLSTLLHNLLMPALVIVDVVRPLLDVDINSTLSVIISELLNYGELDMDVLLQLIIDGIYQNTDADFKYCAIDINNITFSEIVKIADAFLGTDLYESGLVQIGVAGLCSGLEKYEGTPVGTVYKPSVDAADTVTIFVTAIIDCLSYTTPAGDMNGDILCEFIAEKTENPEIAGMYSMILDVISGVELEYGSPDWGYMFENPDLFSLTLPEQSIVYLGYTTDWTPEVADSVYDALDEVLELVLPEVLEEDADIAALINGLLTDNVYTDANLNTIVELLVNLLADFDATLFELVDCVVNTDIATWFTFCEEATDPETNETVWVCNYNWGVDAAATAEEKKDLFIDGLQAVLTPANELLSWVFFGTEYAFFTSSEIDENGNFTYADLITFTGGEGYAFGLAPIFEALGCEVKPAAAFYDAATGKYNTGAAVESILNSVLALVDEIAANPVEEVFELLPNLIYFINAGGIKTSVNNLLAPVDAIIEKLAPVISEDGSDVTLGALLEGEIGLNISDITMDTLLGFAADAGFVMNNEMYKIVTELYVGNLAEYTSVNGRTAYRLNVEGYEGDILTIILSLALDAFNLNAELFSDLLGEETYYAVYNLIRGTSEAFVYREMNWAYMYDGEDAASQLYNNNLPERTGDSFTIYTQYQNNWNKATADYLDSVLKELVTGITTAASDNGTDLGIILGDAIADGIYQDSILNSLIESLVELMLDYEDIIKSAGALIGAEGIAAWFDDYCTITYDENGNAVVTCVKNWGIDAAATNDEKAEAFVEGFVTILEPAYDLLAWLLFGEDFTFLNGTTNNELITIKGGMGYDNAFVPLLEGLSCTMNYAGTASGIKPASAFYVNGELDMETAVRDVFTALADCLSDICGDISGSGTLDVMLEKLPNLLYFVNADGAKVVVNNLLQPVNNILDKLAPMGVEVDFDTLIEGIALTDLDFYAVFDILENELGLYFPDYTQEFLATFYIGQVVPYESANGKLAYRMTYSETETRRDMITCLISFVVDAFVDERNDECLIGWMGEDIYYAIIDILNISEAKAMQSFDWILTEYADTDKSFTAIESSVKYTAAYNKIWTEDKAEYIADNLTDFVNDILCLLGLKIGDHRIASLDTLLNALLTTELYTQATADALLGVLKDLIGTINGLEPYGEYIAGILDTAFGVNIATWETMTVTVVDGDRDSFIAAVEEMLAPVVPLLDVLLCGENISLFYTIDGSGEDAITIYGSEGYAYGIIPLFEALGCKMTSPAEFYALDDEAKINAIIEPLLARVDEILADPANEIIDMLPAIIYFINSNGLDTAVNNIINSVDTVLVALEPIIGEASLMELLGVDLATYDFEYLMTLATDAITESTGLDTTAVLVDFVAELTTGKVVSYTSANGETYYTMQYAGEWQKTDMVTIVLRLIIDFLAEGDNAEAIITLLSNNAESTDAANSTSTLIKFILTALATEPVTSGAMATLYYIFYGVHTGIDALDKEYHRFNNTWKVLLLFFESYGDPVTSTAVKVLRNILDTYFEGIVDTDGVAAQGAMTFWEKIKAFFERIAEFFRKLFGMS